MPTSSKCDFTNLSPARKRLIFRGTHRGMREMDIILGGFIENNIANFTDSQLKQLEELLEINDQILFQWILNGVPDDMMLKFPILQDVISYRQNIKFS